MSSLVHHIVIDCSDPYTLAGFWAEALEGSLADDDFAGDPEAQVTSAGASLLFVSVPDAKETKNRIHLDIQPQDRTRDEEADRLYTLGASLAADHRRPDGSGWLTLTDPEVNEFCVVRSAKERAS